MKHLMWLVLVAACDGGFAGHTAPPAAGDAPVINDSLYLEVFDVGGQCNVSIGGAAPSAEPDQAIGDYSPGDTIGLTAAPAAGFTLGPWHHTDQDTGSGDPNAATTVTLRDEPGCVWICCPSATSACPTADPCR